MFQKRAIDFGVLALAGLALGGCVAAAPATQLVVVPGEGRTDASLRADDTACRSAGGTSTTATAAQAPITTVTPVTSQQYYACMAARGQSVIEQPAQAYPAYAGYAPYAYPGYAYPYGAPYGYPYYGGYARPYVGFGIGFGYGGFNGRRGWR